MTDQEKEDYLDIHASLGKAFKLINDIPLADKFETAKEAILVAIGNLGADLIIDEMRNRECQTK